MLSHWKLYVGTLIGIWSYTVLILVVHAVFAVSFGAAILGVAIGWSITNAVLTIVLAHESSQDTLE